MHLQAMQMQLWRQRRTDGTAAAHCHWLHRLAATASIAAHPSRLLDRLESMSEPSRERLSQSSLTANSHAVPLPLHLV